jgi:hypothetical protein
MKVPNIDPNAADNCISVFFGIESDQSHGYGLIYAQTLHKGFFEMTFIMDSSSMVGFLKVRFSSV